MHPLVGSHLSASQLILAGISGLMAGAFSMALGEYVSVWSQRDAQLADIAKEKAAQAAGPQSQAAELRELAEIYMTRGLDPPLAMQVTSSALLFQGEVIKHRRLMDLIGSSAALAVHLQCGGLQYSVGVVRCALSAYLQKISLWDT